MNDENALKNYNDLKTKYRNCGIKYLYSLIDMSIDVSIIDVNAICENYGIVLKSYINAMFVLNKITAKEHSVLYAESVKEVRKYHVLLVELFNL